MYTVQPPLDTVNSTRRGCSLICSMDSSLGTPVILREGNKVYQLAILIKIKVELKQYVNRKNVTDRAIPYDTTHIGWGLPFDICRIHLRSAFRFPVRGGKKSHFRV